MSSPPGPPKYIYKILPYSPPSPLPVCLPLSDLDSRDGFIHMSTSKQVLGTLQNFFKSAPSVVILRVEYEGVKPRIKWEISKGLSPDEKGGCWDTEGRLGGFPHIYHTKDGELKLGIEEVESVGTWIRGGDVWSKDGWPFGEDVPTEG